MTNNKHQDVDRGTLKAGKTRSPKKPIKHVTLTEIKNKKNKKKTSDGEARRKKEALMISGSLKWE